MKIKKGDKVIVISGNDKGKKGQVLQVLPQEARVVVEGVNIVKCHKKPSNSQPNGGILKKEAPISVSNVAILDPKEKKATRVGYKIVDGKKVRFAKKSGEFLDK